MSGSLKEMLAAARLSQPDAPVEPPPVEPPPAAPPPEPAPAPAPLQENISKAEEAIRKRLFRPRKAAQKPPVAPATPAATATPTTAEPGPQVTPPAEPEPAPTPAPAPAKRVATRDPAADYADRLEKLQREQLELERQKLEWEKQQRQPAAPQPQVPRALALMSDDERYEYEVFGQMDKAETGKDYQARFIRSVEAAAAYKAAWEKKNEGEAFDPNDSAHDEFYAKNSLRYDKLAFRRAEMKLAQPEPPKPDESTQRELRALRLKTTMSEITPRMMRATALAIKGMLEDVDGGVAKLVETAGAAELLKKHPAKGPKFLEAAAAINRVAGEAYQLLETGGLVEPDNSNPVHSLILGIISRQEPMISAQPLAEQRLEDGRMFATWEKWVSLTPEQQAQHWHLGAEEVLDIFSQAQAARVKDEVGAIEREFQSRAPATTTATTPPPAEPPQPAPRPSPSGGSRSVIDTTVTRPPEGPPNLDKKLRSILFQRAS